MKPHDSNTDIQSEHSQTAQLEQPQAASPPAGKFYTPAQVLVGSFFGSILMGVYMMSHNFRLMGQPRRAFNIWLVVVPLLGLIIAIEIEMKIDNTYLNPIFILLTAAAYYLTKKWQLEAIDNHLSQGGSSKRWRPIVLILVSFYLLVMSTTMLLIFNYIY